MELKVDVFFLLIGTRWDETNANPELPAMCALEHSVKEIGIN